MPIGTFPVRVQSIGKESEEIKSYILADPSGEPLPEYLAGAHVDVYLENGLIRQFSLCGSDADRRHYRIGVLREVAGAGGSEYFFKHVKVGDMLTISEPKNLFKLSPDAQRHLLIAGGIGITPILSMIYQLERQNADYVIHYCARSLQAAAFRQDLKSLVPPNQLNFHFDGGDPKFGLDLKAILGAVIPGTHLYYCGPPSLMAAANAGSSHWPEGTVHCEHFSADSLDKSKIDASPGNGEFQVRLASSGSEFTIPSNRSIVEVLRENGVFVDTSCEEGFCGTCLTRYLEGEPMHRDQILDDDDRDEYVLICCARSKTPRLLLDL